MALVSGPGALGGPSAWRLIPAALTAARPLRQLPPGLRSQRFASCARASKSPVLLLLLRARVSPPPYPSPAHPSASNSPSPHSQPFLPSSVPPRPPPSPGSNAGWYKVSLLKPMDLVQPPSRFSFLPPVLCLPPVLPFPSSPLPWSLRVRPLLPASPPPPPPPPRSNGRFAGLLLILPARVSVSRRHPRTRALFYGAVRCF